MATHRFKVRDRREVDPESAPRLMLRQANDLFEDEKERDAFIQSIREHDSKEQAIILLQDRPEVKTFPRIGPAPWQPDFIYRIADHFRASKHSLYEKGAYYSLDLSSVFSASAMLAIAKTPQRILDLCASPGGKAIFAYRAFSPEILMCNETVRKRTDALIGNLERCGIKTASVWSADPSVYAKKFPELFDLVLCDAPCSGQSLIAKGDKAVGAFNPDMIDMCHSRQRRITGNGVHNVRVGGHMLYATCTYSKQENEKLVAWILREYPQMKAVEVPKLAEFQSVYADFPCYRLHPLHGYGAGAFVCLIQKTGEPLEIPVELPEMPALWRFGDARKAKRERLDPDDNSMNTPIEPTEPVTPTKKRQHFPAAPKRKGGKKPSDQARRRTKRYY